MARRIWTVARVEDIQRLIAEGHSDRQIARTLRCRRTKVSDIRELGAAAVQALAVEKVNDAEPTWALVVDWTAVEGEIRRGFEVRIAQHAAAAHEDLCASLALPIKMLSPPPGIQHIPWQVPNAIHALIKLGSLGSCVPVCEYRALFVRDFE